MNEIQEKFNRIIEYSQKIINPKTDKLFSNWAVNKNLIIEELLGGELIYTHPEKITFSLDYSHKDIALITFRSKVKTTLNNDPKYQSFFDFLNSLSVVEFFDNKLAESYALNKEKNIPRGTKVIKAFKYFIEDKILLSHIQDLASEYIQSNVLTGYLCFSVHPLDFLSLSENDSNWRSCHALNGDFRVGNLSYMQDSSTVICYLKSEKEVSLPNFPPEIKWNNKKWRCLLFFNKNYDAIFAGRQYPFFTDGALSIIRNILINKKIIDDGWSHWHNDYITFEYSEHSCEDSSYIEDEYLVMRDEVYKIGDLVKDADRSMHYNDLLESSIYTRPYYMFSKFPSFEEVAPFKIGYPTLCLSCEEEYLDDSEFMHCEHCDVQVDNYGICDHCGRNYILEEGSWVDEDFRVCPHCFENEFIYCECCHNYYHKSQMYWNAEKNINICENCLRKENENG